MIEGRHLLVATGRKPADDGLGLDAAGIRHDRSGIVVNKNSRPPTGASTRSAMSPPGNCSSRTPPTITPAW